MITLTVREPNVRLYSYRKENRKDISLLKRNFGGNGMITIDKKICTGCGLCVRDCFTNDIELSDGTAQAKGRFCIECGHCLAICPENAITLNGFPAEDIINVNDDDRLDPDKLLRWMKTRRTIRTFTDELVSSRDLQKILDMGMYSPKGGNIQNVSYVVIEEHLSYVRKLAVESLYEISDLSEEQKKIPNMTRYAEKWKKMYQDLNVPGAPDLLFFDAPLVIVVFSPSNINACIAAAHMESMVYALGLGMVYSGFTTRAVNASSALKEFFAVGENAAAQASLIIGHPAVRYQRSVPKKKPLVIYR
ncbi:MAG: nitroreductase family protein [Saccharofermentanales bacterium]